MMRALFCISGNGIEELLSKLRLCPVLLWRKEDKLARKRKEGVILYNKPPKNLFSIAHKKAEIHRHLCTAAYR